jgi:predicted lipoprotein with Yx(FWY)xxD motif
MKRNNHHFPMAGLAIGMLLSIASCKKNNYNSNPPASLPPVVPKLEVQLADNAKFGKIMTDSNGRSLYFFSNDAADTATCYGGCSTAWPTFYSKNLTLSDGLKSADFATITRNDGTKQTTYKGWPLYYYQNDAKAGDVNGDPIGKVWFVAKPDYTVMISNTQLKGNDGNLYDSLYTVGVTGPTRYITDDHGHTLYNFKNDSFNINKYTKPDYSNNASWPVDTLSAITSVPSTLSKADFANITVVGRTQLTYKGRPLYFFGPDAAKRGSNKGVSVPNANKPITWPIANESTTVGPKP